MTKKIIALYDSNEDFICRLCSGFQQNCTLSLEFLPFTSLENFLRFILTIQFPCFLPQKPC